MPQKLRAVLFVLALACPIQLAAADAAADVAEQLAEKISSSPTSIRSVLSSYNRVEASQAFDIFGRHAIHEAMLKALRDSDGDDIHKVTQSVLRSTTSSWFPSQVLLMKALIGKKYPAPEAERVAMLSELVGHKNEEISLWAVRLLGESGWPEAVDELIALLEREEAKELTSFLSSILSTELYRLLGAKGRGTPPAIRKNWEDMKRKLPDEVSYDVAEGDDVTVAFFGDRISPRSMFVIDTSSSMLQKTTLRQEGSRGKTATKEEKSSGPKIPKVDIVKQELARAVSGLQAHCRFNIIAYNAKYETWRQGRAGIELVKAGTESLRSAKGYAEALQVGTGTNIHDSLSAALDVPGVETVYLLSDGEPSRGGGKPQIESMAAAKNYLKAVRIVTYGFAAEGKGSYDEEFMKRLAKNHWGWYRRLN